jgi:hypothetical protein
MNYEKSEMTVKEVPFEEASSVPLKMENCSSSSSGETSPNNDVLTWDISQVSGPNGFSTIGFPRSTLRMASATLPVSLGLSEVAGTAVTAALGQKHGPTSNSKATGARGTSAPGKAQGKSRPKSPKSKQVPKPAHDQRKGKGIQKPHSAPRSDQTRRTCFVCGSESHIKAQCPKKQSQNSGKQKDSVYQNLLGEMDKLKGENDALREIADAADQRLVEAMIETASDEEAVEVVQPKNEESKPSDCVRLEQKTWEYDMPTEEGKLIASRALEMGAKATDVAFFFGYSLWLWLKVFVFYVVVRITLALIHFELLTYLFNRQMYIEFQWADNLYLAMDGVLEELDDVFWSKFRRHRWVVDWYVDQTTGAFRPIPFVMRLCKHAFWLSIVLYVFQWTYNHFQLFWWVSLVSKIVPYLVAPSLLLLYYYKSSIFRTRHVYKVLEVGDPDFDDQRPISISLCEMEIPRVEAYVNHRASVWIDLGFFGAFKFCDIIDENITPNLELMTQMTSNVNMFFPDDETAFAYFTKQPSRIQSVNTNRVDDILHDQTAQTSLVAFAVYKDFKRRARLAGLPC